MGTHPIFESDFDCLTEIEKKVTKMDSLYTVTLTGGGPWGIRIQGGKDFSTPLSISRVTAGGKGFQAGIKMGEQIVEINGQSTVELVHVAAQKLIKNTEHTLELTLNRSSDTSKGLLTNINRWTNIFRLIERRTDPDCAKSGETQDTI